MESGACAVRGRSVADRGGPLPGEQRSAGSDTDDGSGHWQKETCQRDNSTREIQWVWRRVRVCVCVRVWGGGGWTGPCAASCCCSLFQGCVFDSQALSRSHPAESPELDPGEACRGGRCRTSVAAFPERAHLLFSARAWNVRPPPICPGLCFLLQSLSEQRPSGFYFYFGIQWRIDWLPFAPPPPPPLPPPSMLE